MSDTEEPSPGSTRQFTESMSELVEFWDETCICDGGHDHHQARVEALGDERASQVLAEQRALTALASILPLASLTSLAAEPNSSPVERWEPTARPAPMGMFGRGLSQAWRSLGSLFSGRQDDRFSAEEEEEEETGPFFPPRSGGRISASQLRDLMEFPLGLSVAPSGSYQTQVLFVPLSADAVNAFGLGGYPRQREPDGSTAQNPHVRATEPNPEGDANNEESSDDDNGSQGDETIATAGAP